MTPKQLAEIRQASKEFDPEGWLDDWNERAVELAHAVPKLLRQIDHLQAQVDRYEDALQTIYATAGHAMADGVGL